MKKIDQVEISGPVALACYKNCPPGGNKGKTMMYLFYSININTTEVGRCPALSVIQKLPLGVHNKADRAHIGLKPIFSPTLPSYQQFCTAQDRPIFIPRTLFLHLLLSLYIHFTLLISIFPLSFPFHLFFYHIYIIILPLFIFFPSNYNSVIQLGKKSDYKDEKKREI